LSEVRLRRQPSDPPLFAWFHRYYRPPKGRRSPARFWSAVLHGASQDTSQILVPGRTESGGVRFSVRPGFLLFLSGPWRPTDLGKFTKPAASYHGNTSYTLPLRGQGSFNLNLIGFLLCQKARPNFTSSSLWCTPW
jgi:hypothetical protein